MEGMILLAVMWFVFQLIGSTAKKAQKAQEAQKRRASSAASAPAPAYEPPQSAYPQTTLFEGDSYEDDSGCVGGSMPHEAHEGAQWGSLDYQPAVVYAPRVQAAQQEPAPVREGGKITPQQMRSAVVMAEVLGRPVSMRGRRTGGRLFS